MVEKCVCESWFRTGQVQIDGGPLTRSCIPDKQKREVQRFPSELPFPEDNHGIQCGIRLPPHKPASDMNFDHNKVRQKLCPFHM